ncbi:MAG: hypothetical protein HYS77_00210 [Candidatus Rokubacteria bacterium]|nr:hypothetical protein [Candidatus Rokubacteria bacterium]
MDSPDDLQPRLRQRATDALRRLAPADREALLIKCWMSHDARWFMAVARECGLPVANRLHREAARERGRGEAPRLARALGLGPVTSLDEYLLVQEALIGLLGPDLLDYRVSTPDGTACRVDVARCFAHENAMRAGIADEYECGIFARIAGWLDGLGLAHELRPALGKCLKAQGRGCAYTITLAPRK